MTKANSCTLPQAKALLADRRPIDEAAIRHGRLERLRRQLAEHDVAAALIFDPINLRYATGSRNMQVWTMHNFVRYGFVAANGPCILFDLMTSKHLAAGLETVDEIRPAWSADYVIVAERAPEIAGRWAAEIAELVRAHGGANRRLAVDRFDVPTALALQAQGLTLVDGKIMLERARARKSLEEIRALKRSFEACDAAVAEMRDGIEPGMTEQAAFGLLLKAILARGGEYPETRLLTAGPRTNPWFQEASDRPMRRGEMLSFDTDLIGPMGFYTDISRAWTVDGGKPSDAQRRLYAAARAQLDHNMALLKPGIRFLEFSARAYALPEIYHPNRYADVAHGCGLNVEYPLIWYPEDEEWGAYDGLFEENMVVCCESYVGAVGGPEGVKLEQPVWITAEGPLLLSDYPLEDGYD
ncbi:peptidase M24 [Hypericibacter adhaerens]|jgi:Xaa-Pro aminopeptidase|uniref:Peptidase M24 n=2 Tax=Hypericibacter adhaerens TaxID=2602016 RepID=A0A5J6MU27_9PROT|nr:Xaa-Pro peptidase family protein [Hypericibacter adhaerens]QEX20667.1 peptidase M24 [Hypericibacter adhaerens]